MAEVQEQISAQSLRWGWLERFSSQRSRLAVLALLTALVLSIYALVNHALGFPLDDAWIHQDFARTLAQSGRFAYAPDRSGAGSTSPLWVLLLAPAQLIPSAPLWLVVLWANTLGALALFGLAWATGALVERWLAEMDSRVRAAASLLAGCAVITEWHLTWASLSGMETLLFVFLSMLLLLGVGRGWHAAWLGVLAAGLTCTRPEGAVLAFLVAIALLLKAQPATQRKGQRWYNLLLYLGVSMLGLVPLLALNEVASGHLLPSTFYAKGAYYALGGSELERLAGYGLGVLQFLWSSPPVVLGLPGAGYLLWQERRAWRDSTIWLALMWGVALIGVYAVHLPVVYQNGRYLMPVLPVLLALGIVGWLRLLKARRYALLPIALLALGLGLGLLSVGRGAGIYAANVRYINEYQVATALWLRAHTPLGALVATHDIGAIGYFSDRHVIDLGGLTQPEIVPLLSDQRALVAYLKQQRVEYVVMFPDWFPSPHLLLLAVQQGEVYRAHDPVIAAIGGSDLVTYQTGWGVPAALSDHVRRSQPGRR
ncbi:MAG TPA: hypothetical protein VFU32_10325 [Ktedonobacterales bacterium]|nr:hypothetical protein [Ktedonobacterales bacterium]